MIAALLMQIAIVEHPGEPSRPGASRCAEPASAHLALLDAGNRLLALERAEHEVGVDGTATSRRLVQVRSRAGALRARLAATGCEASGIVPAYDLYVPPARACARVEAGAQPDAEFQGCDPFTWRVHL